jgi:hypothetical protein
MTTKITIDVPMDHEHGVTVLTQSKQGDYWKDDEPVTYGPGSHWLHIYEGKRIAAIGEGADVAFPPKAPFETGDVVRIKGQGNQHVTRFTVMGCFTAPNDPNVYVGVAVCWLDEAEFKTAQMPPAILLKVD